MEVGAAQNAIRDPGAPPAGDFMGVKLPVLFVDTYDQEHSRDIEPMKGGLTTITTARWSASFAASKESGPCRLLLLQGSSV